MKHTKLLLAILGVVIFALGYVVGRTNQPSKLLVEDSTGIPRLTENDVRAGNNLGYMFHAFTKDKPIQKDIEVLVGSLRSPASTNRALAVSMLGTFGKDYTKQVLPSVREAFKKEEDIAPFYKMRLFLLRSDPDSRSFVDEQVNRMVEKDPEFRDRLKLYESMPK